MKYLVIAVLIVAAVVAEEKPEDERPKTYRRLIPADVLRGYEPNPAPPQTPKVVPPPVPPGLSPNVEIEPKVPTIDNNDIDLNNNNNNESKNNTTTSVDSGASRQHISLTRALTSYLFPIAVMWFGGCLTEWL